MTRLRTPILVAACLTTLGACVIDARERDMIVPPERTIERRLPAGKPLVIRVPAGEVKITNSADDVLRGRALVRCPDLESRCARYLRDVQFVLDDGPDGQRLHLSENRARVYRHGSIEVEVSVPVSHPLTIDLTAGELDVDVGNCLRVDMEAGDASFRFPADRVRAVHLDAGVGDASLKVAGRHYGSRSWLVGAEAHWNEGAGDCDVRIDLQAGDVRAEVY